MIEMSKVEMMQKLFPKCPICSFEEGYEFSAFYPDVRCKSCRCEWSLSEYGMELKGTSEAGWIRKLLNKQYSFDFWKKLKEQEQKEPPIADRILAPMDCVGGAPERIAPTKGYIIFRSEKTVAYKGRENYLDKIETEIPIEGIREVAVKTKGISPMLSRVLGIAFGVVGLIPEIVSPEKKFLILSYEDSFGMLHHMVFDFHDDEKAVNELMKLLDYSKEKRQDKN